MRQHRGVTKTAAAIAIIIIVILAYLAVYYTYHHGGTQVATTTTTTSSSTTTTTTTTATSTLAGPKALVIETSQAYVVVGPKGSVVPSLPGGKKIIVVAYEVDKNKTKPVENSTGFVDINPAFYRNSTIDALIIAARRATDPFIRYQLYEAIHKLSSVEVPIVWLGQYVLVRNNWDWLHGRYYHPTLAERYDLLWEDPDAPTVQIGIGNYVNNQHTYSIVTIGWPQSFDPAADYETFGWEVWHNIGDTLVTYWKNDTEHISPDLAVAWAHNENGTEWYFVIRGGVKAFDPWHNTTYNISAIDVLFSIWRIARLQLDPSWMITEFFDMNASSVLSEDEFNQVLQNGGLIAEYNGKTIEPKSMNELLQAFGYSGSTAGVVMLKLYRPYGAILSILADPFVSVIPMKYFFDNVDQLKGKYEQALADSNNGKDPSAWAKYIGVGSQEPTHLYLHQYPIGTGPYYVKEYQENSYLVLQYNPYYWNKTLWNTSPYGENGKPIHETVIYLINNDAVSRIEILKAGQADVGAIPLDRLKDIEGYQFPNSNHKIVIQTGALEPTIVYIVLNAHKAPFNNTLVREALAYAVPFDRIKDIVYAGYLARLYGVIPAGFPGHNDNIAVNYTFDLAKARQLMQQAGIDPTKYSFEIWYNSGNSQREKIATLLQTYWGQLGFKITVRALQWGTLLDKTEKGDFDVYIIGWAPDYLDPDDYAGPLLYGGTRFSVLDFQLVNTTVEAQQVFGSP